MSEQLIPSRPAIDAALARVYDPELDDSVLRLGFIEAVEMCGGHVTVRYNVPTFWCAPNFVFLMSADIHAEVGQVPGVTQVTVLVGNNCVADEVNQGVNSGRSFAETFGDDATGEGLEELRRTFIKKGFLARQDVLIRRLRQADLSDVAILALCETDLAPAGEDLRVQTATGALRVRLGADDLARYLHKRRKLGLPMGAGAPLFSTLEGVPLREAELADYLRRSRAVRMSIAFNTTFCEGLLRTTYHPELAGRHDSVGDRLIDLSA